ncbi:MAG: methyltransferase domain-containing protein [Gammaproteobacteria bacterium]
MHTEVQRYYGETLESSEDLKTTACCTAEAPPKHISRLLAEIHEEVKRRYYGCGLVLPEALNGLRVLDLGCGAGRDVFLLSRLVGPEGHVTGVDMTPEQLDVARSYQQFHMDRFGYESSNVDFVEANIEQLDQTDLADSSFDLIVSNCVINLAVDKEAVLRSAFRLLKPGGEMYFSDIYADRRVPEPLTRDPVLYGECLAGAMYWNDFLELARVSGFVDPRLMSTAPLSVTDADLQQRLGDLQFCSATFRLFRLEQAETGREDYGQQAVYRGSVPEFPEQFRLDHETVFIKGQPQPICGNTRRLLEVSRFSPHFELIGDYSHHLGTFGSTMPAFGFTEDTQVAAKSACC